MCEYVYIYIYIYIYSKQMQCPFQMVPEKRCVEGKIVQCLKFLHILIWILGTYRPDVTCGNHPVSHDIQSQNQISCINCKNIFDIFFTKISISKQIFPSVHKIWCTLKTFCLLLCPNLISSQNFQRYININPFYPILSGSTKHFL